MTEILYFANLSFSLTSNNKVLFTYFISLLNYTIESCPATEKKKKVPDLVIQYPFK